MLVGSNDLCLGILFVQIFPNMEGWILTKEVFINLLNSEISFVFDIYEWYIISWALNKPAKHSWI